MVDHVFTILFAKLDFLILAVLISLPWNSALALLVACHGVLLDTGLPVLLVLGCAHRMGGFWVDSVFCCVLLLLDKFGFGSWFMVLVALVSWRPVAIAYAMLMLSLGIRVGERHIWAVGLAIGLASDGSADAARVAAPITALLLLGALWGRLKHHASLGRFCVSSLMAVSGTVLVGGGPVAVASWMKAKLAALYLEAALLGFLGLSGVGLAVVTLGVGTQTKSRDRKWFHVIMTWVIGVPLVVFGNTSRTTESLALGGCLAVCVLLAVELFRLYSGANVAAQSLNGWYKNWLDEKEHEEEMAFSHIYLVLGCTIPFALAHFAKLSSIGVAAKLAGIVSVGVG